MSQNLAARYAYRSRYVPDVPAFLEAVRDKTVIPHQLEVQPGPEAGKSICWLRCPYCYGGSASDDGERLGHERYQEILRQSAAGPHGAIDKVVFAGYATDPLFYGGIEDLLAVVRDNDQVFGFHTKALAVRDRLIDLATAADIRPMSYFSASVDAGTEQSYARVHGMGDRPRGLYARVLANLGRITAARDASGAPLDVSATYLLTRTNSSTDEVLQAVRDLRAAGVDLVRFSFPQVPRGFEDRVAEDPAADDIPRREEVDEIVQRLRPVLESETSERTTVVLMDLDAEYEITRARSLPCFARFVYPTIGFDGRLANCSESSSPHFRGLALGDLRKVDFWDAFYDYDGKRLESHLEASARRMDEHGCRCDRKEHVVNDLVGSSNSYARRAG